MLKLLGNGVTYTVLGSLLCWYKKMVVSSYGCFEFFTIDNSTRIWRMHRTLVGGGGGGRGFHDTKSFWNINGGGDKRGGLL